MNVTDTQVPLIFFSPAFSSRSLAILHGPSLDINSTPSSLQVCYLFVFMLRVGRHRLGGGTVQNLMVAVR